MAEVAFDTESTPIKVNSLLLPLHNMELLVPQLSVAEVVSLSDVWPRVLSENPECYGWIKWREQSIPLLSFEGICHEQKPELKEGFKVVICNAVFGAVQLGFYGLVLTNFPRSIHLGAEDAMHYEATTSGQGVKMFVNIKEGDQAIIPDFTFLEEHVLKIVEQKKTT